MTTDAWTRVDRYVADLFMHGEAALEAALEASAAAGLPAISVSAPHGKFLHLLACIQGARSILEVGTLGVTLGGDRDVLAGGHRQRSGGEAGDTGDEDRRAAAAGGRHADHQAGGRDQAVVGAEHAGAQPGGASGEVHFAVGEAHTVKRARRAAWRRHARGGR